jgi:2'-5' RNA ligase
VFPNFTRPRVLWVGLKKGTEELKNIAQSIDNELEKMGFKKEERDFKPHLTIGRIKFIPNPQKFLQKMNSEEFKGEMFTAREILIMKSDLKPTGAIYTKLHIIEFVV